MYHKGVDTGAASYGLSQEKWDQMRKDRKIISERWDSKLDELQQEYQALLAKLQRSTIEAKIAEIRERIILGRTLAWHVLINHDQRDALTFVCDTSFNNWKVLVVRAMKDTKVVSEVELEFLDDDAEIGVLATLRMHQFHFKGKVWNPVKLQWTKREIMSLAESR